MTHILVSNDDGILAPGLKALALTMGEFGKVTVVGPEENQSANGHRKTLTKPLRVNPVELDPSVKAFSTDGSPADCIALALMGIVEEPIDIIVSGINRGANLGQDLTYSGTVAAAFEGTIHRVPSIAFSLDDPSLNADYSTAAQVAHQVVAQVLEHSLPPMTLLNVNIPKLPSSELKGIIMTRQGTRLYHDKLISRMDPQGRPYYWIGGEAPTGDISVVGTDVWAVHNGYVSITPIHLDMTNHSMIDIIRDWKF